MTEVPDAAPIESALFNTLYDDILAEDQFDQKRPLLAHYTSLQAFENIVLTNEIWFSNPLMMNDLEEIKFGVLNGWNALKASPAIKSALKTDKRHEIFVEALDKAFREYEEHHLFDTYVFCMSAHDPKNTDGLLSMWRGYGGNGKGVALVFDTAALNMVPAPTPLILAKVAYATTAERWEWINRMISRSAGIIENNFIEDGRLHLASFAIFDRIKLFALFSKHAGFKEEDEWRAVYRRDMDGPGRYDDMFGYLNGSRGVEPKLKFRIEPNAKLPTSQDLSLEKLVAGIILGPSTSSALALMSVKRMLTSLGRPALAAKVYASSIPLRDS